MKKIYRKFALWLTQLRPYRWLLINVIPYIRFTTYYTSLRGWKYLRGYKLLNPGDIILAVDKKKLTSVLIPGKYAHAALCVDKGVEWEISEMTHLNYTKSTFFDVCRESTTVTIFRCLLWDQKYIKEVIEKCKSFVDAKYDTEFKLGVRQLYCSELIYQSDFERRLGASLEDVVGLGIPYISPDGLSKADHIYKVWDSDLEVL